MLACSALPSWAVLDQEAAPLRAAAPAAHAPGCGLGAARRGTAGNAYAATAGLSANIRGEGPFQSATSWLVPGRLTENACGSSLGGCRA